MEEKELHDRHGLEEPVEILPKKHMLAELLKQLVYEVVTYKEPDVKPERFVKSVGGEKEINPRENWID